MSNVIRAKVVILTKWNADKSPEEKRRIFERKLRELRMIVNKKGGLMDKLREKESYAKPSEKKRLKKKKELSRVLARKRDAELEAGNKKRC